ncbi:MAG: Hsp33 family molecular chaperone HslO [Gammaproteobacteria bacterium]|nr:Hsp33 family molecular chaperone HslO [Gammaproteobacteria bacterium]NIR58762.1 Hsp33 family molecular chaperone HslO [Gammaproteobacteria bacterium]NIV73794.1 Hsp33 family molecular chaperone HslO [Gammaproteobacteria bacterium]
MDSGERDNRRRFVFEHSHVRGEVVHLDATWRAVLEREDYPPAVRDLLGEAMAAAALLASTVKLDGSLIIQFHSTGPVYLLVVECTAERTLRGLARWHEPLEGRGGLLGTGRVAITIDPGGDAERYQGIVELDGERPADAVEAYFRRSEQIDTRLWLAADGARAAGLLLQALPGHETSPDAWSRAVHLAATVTERELLKLPVAALLKRLYHEDDLRLFDSEPLAFRCRCSRGRVEEVLRRFGYQEMRALLDERDEVEVTCEYCNQRYVFDPVDIERLFAAARSQPRVPPTRH